MPPSVWWASGHQSLVDLDVGRGGAVLPAVQGLYDCRSTQGARSLTVKPQTQALLTEHMLTEKNDGVSEVALTNSTHVPGFTALLAAGSHTITLRTAENCHGLAYG